jgi:glycosyltransferase involved in cell wall biosynthesis
VPLLEREVPVEVVTRDATPVASLDLYHVADDPAHVFVHRALRRRPGVVLLADWSLHRLARAEAAEQGGAGAYRAEARRAHGTTGAFIARQVERGLAGELPPLLAMNDRVLEASLGLVAFTESVRARAKGRLPGTPVVHLPLDFVGSPVDTPLRGAAREALGVPAGGFLVALLSAPGERAATALRAVSAAEPLLRVRPWPEDPDAGRRLLAAADVAVALEHTPGGGLSSPLVRAIVAGVPTLVSAGTGAASDLPEGVAVRVSPGPSEAAELEALLLRLVRDSRLRVRVGALARAHADARRDPAPAAHALLALAADVERSSGEALRAFAARRAREGTLLASAIEELRWGARALGLADLPPGIEPLVAPLLREGR